MPSLLPIGGPIRLNVSSGGAATVVPLDTGGFAAVYRVQNGPDVFTLYDSDFQAVAQATEIDITDTDQLAPQATALTGGGFVVSWLDQDGTIKASVYDDDGNLTTGPDPVTIATASDPDLGVNEPRIVGNAFGGFTAVWQDNATGNVIVQSYDSAGDLVGDPITVTPPTENPLDTVVINDYRIAVLADGTIVVAAVVQVNGIDLIAYSVNGGPMTTLAGGDDGNIIYINPQITPLASGGYVITYDFVDPTLVASSSPDANWTTGGAVFTSQGNQHDFAIGTTVTTSAGGNFAVDPSVITPLADGGFIVTFEPLTSPLGSGYLVDAQQFDGFGNAVGPVVLVTTQGFLPSVATSANGVVLDTYEFGPAIFLQPYSSAPTPLGPEPSGTSFGLNSVVSANSPGVAPLADGGFVIVYQDANNNSWAEIFGVNRQPIGAAFEVASGASQPVVAAQTNGTFLVAWSTGTQILASLYDDQGNQLSGPFSLSGAPSALPVLDPALNAMSNGGYSMAYETDLQDGTGAHQVTIQLFDGSGAAVGNPVSQTFAPTNPLAPPKIAALERQLFGSATVLGVGDTIIAAIVTDGPTGGTSRLAATSAFGGGFTSSSPTTTTVTVSGNGSAIRDGAQVAELNDGNIVVVWEELPSGAATWNVVGTILTASGVTVGAGFSIGTALPSVANAAHLALTALPDGGFLVTYDSGNTTIAAQRYDATGKAIGGPVLMTAAGQANVVATLLSDGSLLLASDNSPSGGGSITGVVFTVPAIPMSWTGSGSTDLDTAGNWNVNVAPDSGHTLTFSLANGGTLTGAATAQSATFSNGGTWVASGGTIDLTQGMTIQTALQFTGGQMTAGGTASIGVTAGAQVTASAGAQVSVLSTMLGGVTNQTGSLTVSGAGTGWSDTGTGGAGGFQAGNTSGPQSSKGVVTVTQNALLSDSDTDVLGVTSGAEGDLSITSGGTVSNAGLIVGQSGTGVATVNDGTLIDAGSLIIGQNSGAHGTLTVTGGNSSITVAGSMIVGDAGAGSASVNGGTVSVQDLTIGLGAGAGTVDLEGAGTSFMVSGSMVIGGGSAGKLILGAGSTIQVTGALNESSLGQIVFDGGVLDPSSTVIDATNTVMASSTFDAGTLLTNNGAYDIGPGATFTVNTPTIGGTGAFMIGAGSAGLVLNTGSVGAGETVAFADASGMLVLGTNPADGTPGLSGFAATINGYQAGDQIVIQNDVITSGSVTGNVLNLFGAGGVPLGSLTFDTQAAALLAETNIACFGAGTRIATARGSVPVECIRVGDRVCTVLGGDTAEVIWTGYRTVDCARHADPRKVWPVIVAAHAFGRGMPATDLTLSPDHAVHVDGVLIPIRLLINGRTVRQTLVDRISYHHVELERHDVLLANGMPAESYLDTGDRSKFSNGGSVIALHPDFSARAWEMNGCAPLVQTGRVLTAVRKRLAGDVARRRRVVGTFVPGTTGAP